MVYLKKTKRKKKKTKQNDGKRFNLQSVAFIIRISLKLIFLLFLTWQSCIFISSKSSAAGGYLKQSVLHFWKEFDVVGPRLL